jgi:hypothetical protein
VRAASGLFRRLVETALEAGLLSRDELPGRTDEELLGTLRHRVEEAVRSGGEVADESLGRVRELVEALTDRRLPKRCIELFGDELPSDTPTWLQERPGLGRRLEARLAHDWGLEEGVVLVDYPSYPEMLDLRLLLVRERGEVRRLTSAGAEGLLDLPRLSRAMHHSARVLRVFTLPATGPRDPGPLLEVLEAPAEKAEERLGEARPIYA